MTGKTAGASDGIRFFVDRITDGIATLIPDGPFAGEMNLPVLSLPPGVREGDYLMVSFEIDAERGKSVRGEIEALMGEIGNDP